MTKTETIFPYTLLTRISRSVLQSPTRLTILGFLCIIGIGTFFLMLPQSSTDEGINLVNAIFTSTSATCVTGLVVLDTGHDLTLFGQIVVLILIQVGGLGIMTTSTLFLMMVGRRPSLVGRIIIKDALTHGEDRDLITIIREVLKFTLVIEGLGTIFLFLRLLPGKSLGEACYLSFFHSISAFCNAGFSLFSDSFMSFQGDWATNIVIAFLILSGGIGFLVLSEFKRHLPFHRHLWFRLSLHSKLVISTTIILLIFSTLLITIMEWDNTLSPLSTTDSFLVGFFQAVSARTAGFNTVTIGNMANETLFFLILMMFIGASPGSCAGGIKTTTLACLGILGISHINGRVRPQVFKRSISHKSVGKAISVVIVSIIIIITATLLLLMTELGEVPHSASRGKFLELLFEVVSAYGTVGLTTGITGDLSVIGRIIISIVMFIGRLGPLAIAIAVSRSNITRYSYAEEDIMIG